MEMKGVISMADKRKANGQEGVRYKQMTAEIAFTDGGVETVTFYDVGECFDYVREAVKGNYADSVRVELF